MILQINTKELRKYKGQKVKYYLTNSGLPMSSEIGEVVRRQVYLNGEHIPFNRIKSMVLLTNPCSPQSVNEK